MILAVRFDKMGLPVVQTGFLGTKNKKVSITITEFQLTCLKKREKILNIMLCLSVSYLRKSFTNKICSTPIPHPKEIKKMDTNKTKMNSK